MGLGLVAAVSREPGPDALVLVGSGGRAHWDVLSDAERCAPDPIDRSARAAVDRALPQLGPGARQIDEAEFLSLDLRALGARAGFGVVSPYLGLLIHPIYGPWISLRTVVEVAGTWPAAEPLTEYDPCGPCPRPCLDTCPVGAYRRGAAWSFALCADHRLRGRAPARHCDDACHSRWACVVGREHAYGPREYGHRHRDNVAGLAAARGRTV